MKIIPTLSEEEIFRFWDKVLLTANPEKCWPWQANASPRGYGQITIRKKPYRSNRIAYFLSNNEDPGQMYVCHSCDNPSCCNPNHLFLGTNKDNADDMVLKGRSAKGDNHGMSKLSTEDVVQIKALYKTGGYTYKSLGIKFKVSSKNIGYLINNKRWVHLS